MSFGRIYHDVMIDFSAAPEEPLARLMWLTGVRQRAATELNQEWQRTYFQARLEGKLDHAIHLGFHSRKQILAFTRHENESRGRVVKKWADS